MAGFGHPSVTRGWWWDKSTNFTINNETWKSGNLIHKDNSGIKQQCRRGHRVSEGMLLLQVWKIVLGYDCNLQDGKSSWLRPGSQAGLPGDVRGQAGIQAGSQMGGGCSLCLLRDPKGKDWDQWTRATGNSAPGLGRALENSSGAAGEREHHSRTGMAPLWPFLEVQGRPFGLHFFMFKKWTPALCLHSYLGSIFWSTNLGVLCPFQTLFLVSHCKRRNTDTI